VNKQSVLARILKIALVTFALCGFLFVMRPAYYSLLGSIGPSLTKVNTGAPRKGLAETGANKDVYSADNMQVGADAPAAEELALDESPDEEAPSLDADGKAAHETTAAEPAAATTAPANAEEMHEDTATQESAGPADEADPSPSASSSSMSPVEVLAGAMGLEAVPAPNHTIAVQEDEDGESEKLEAQHSENLRTHDVHDVEEQVVVVTPPPPPPVQEAEAAEDDEPKPSAKPSSARKNYDPAHWQLSPMLVQPHLRENIVMVTWANNHYYDFVQNWVYNIKKLKISNFMVGAMDNDLLVRMIDEDIPTFAMQSNMTTSDFGWGTPNFHKMGRKKIQLIRDFTLMGFDILVSDVDTVWMRDPVPYFQEYKDADILTSSDHLSTTAKDGGLENHRQAASPANIGIMLIRHTAKELTSQWVEVLRKNDLYWDQNAFNDLMRKGLGHGIPSSNRVFTGFMGKLKIGILPVGLFCSGHTFFVQRMHEKYNLDPYVVHATFQFSGTEGKRHRMRESLLWIDPPEYHNRPGGFLIYKPNIPQTLIDNSGTVETHFDLVNFQMAQVRSALALAQATNRALIMPQLWCGFDRWWAPHKGRIPGSDMTLPFKCPMDHVFEVETWLRDRDQAHFGPRVDFRESSFLDNPRTPTAVKSSILKVDICMEAGVAGCSDATALVESSQLSSDTDQITVAEGILFQEAIKLFEPFKDRKVLEFSHMSGSTFGGFQDKKLTDQFYERTKYYAGIWCCKHAHPGHIWYDMWFDHFPHTDRHNRVWKESWHPMTGP